MEILGLGFSLVQSPATESHLGNKPVHARAYHSACQTNRPRRKMDELSNRNFPRDKFQMANRGSNHINETNTNENFSEAPLETHQIWQNHGYLHLLMKGTSRCASPETQKNCISGVTALERRILGPNSTSSMHPREVTSDAYQGQNTQWLYSGEPDIKKNCPSLKYGIVTQ